MMATRSKKALLADAGAQIYALANAGDIGALLQLLTEDQIKHLADDYLDNLRTELKDAYTDPSQEMLNFFAVERRNEDQGGVRPATLGSAWDSAQQAPEDVLAGWAGDAEGHEDDEGTHHDFDRKDFLHELQWLVQQHGAETPLTAFLAEG